jgi:hypothetical protein
VQSRCKRVLRLHQPCQHRQNSHKQEQSRGQIDIPNSTSLLHCPNYYKTKKSRDNSCYGWCCSLIFVCDHLGWGGSLAVLAHWLSQHGTVPPHLMSHFGQWATLANEPPGTLQHQDTHTSMRHNSTNMDPIQEAIEYLAWWWRTIVVPPSCNNIRSWLNNVVTKAQLLYTLKCRRSAPATVT